jgi:hypothetical protein
MQVHGSEFRSGWTCAKTVYRTEGLNAFYVSYPTTLMMTVPFTAVQFTAYEYLKSTFNPSGSYSPVTHVTAGGLAGGVAAAITTPLDVAKTLLQTKGTSQDHQIRAARGIMDACKIIWERNGARGFFRGVSPRVVTFMPSNALCWLSYEFFSKCFCFIRPSRPGTHQDCFFSHFVHRKSYRELRCCQRAIGRVVLDCRGYMRDSILIHYFHNTSTINRARYLPTANL